ncbi:MAG: class I SAM-dependent methyltransferase [Thermomicrobiales bacterium]
MADPRFSGLRLWDGSRPESARLSEPAEELPELLMALSEELARHETLRVGQGTTRHEPLSLQWFLDLQAVRHGRQGHWMPRLLEFDRHAGERLLSLGAGLGSDLIEYARHDAEVVAACPSATQLALIRRNFELHGLSGTFLHTAPTALPLESSSIDVVNLTGLLQESPDPARLVSEIYRVLKPGGKLLAVLPAHRDVDFWSRYLAFGETRPVPPPDEANPLLHATRRYRGAELRQLFVRFSEPRLYQRHLRRSEVPHLYRWLPLALLERLLGRLLVFKAFKPVSSAISEQAAA